MPLALHDVKHIAHLAHLELNETQAVTTLEKLNQIFTLVEQMRAIDTTNILPLHHPTAALQQESALHLREDVVTEQNQRALYQQTAPAVDNGLYLVPKVIE